MTRAARFRPRGRYPTHEPGDLLSRLGVAVSHAPYVVAWSRVRAVIFSREPGLECFAEVRARLAEEEEAAAGGS